MEFQKCLSAVSSVFNPRVPGGAEIAHAVCKAVASSAPVTQGVRHPYLGNTHALHPASHRTTLAAVPQHAPSAARHLLGCSYTCQSPGSFSFQGSTDAVFGNGEWYYLLNADTTPRPVAPGTTISYNQFDVLTFYFLPAVNPTGTSLLVGSVTANCWCSGAWGISYDNTNLGATSYLYFDADGELVVSTTADAGFTQCWGDGC